jgi:hypothetical protein
MIKGNGLMSHILQVGRCCYKIASKGLGMYVGAFMDIITCCYANEKET